MFYPRQCCVLYCVWLWFRSTSFCWTSYLFHVCNLTPVFSCHLSNSLSSVFTPSSFETYLSGILFLQGTTTYFDKLSHPYVLMVLLLMVEGLVIPGGFNLCVINFIMLSTLSGICFILFWGVFKLYLSSYCEGEKKMSS